MSSRNEAAPAFALRLRSSRGLAGVMLLCWLPLAILAWQAAGDTAFAVPLTMLVGALAAVAASRGLRPTQGLPFSEFVVRGNQLLGRNGQGSLVECMPSRSSRLFSRLAWLELRTEDGRRARHRLILTDLPGLANLPREDFRRLRVWLRLVASYH